MYTPITRGEVSDKFQTWLDSRTETVEHIGGDINSTFFSVIGNRSGNFDPFRSFINLLPIREPIELTERDLEIYQDFMVEFISLEIFPDEIRKIPENSKEELGKFWVKLIANPEFINQFFASIRLYSDSLNLIPQLQDIVEEIREKFSKKLPESKINNLESAVKEISIPHPQPSMEEIYAAIKEAEIPTLTLENQENISLLPEIQSLSEEAKNWLRNLFIYLVQNPNLQPDIYNVISAMNQLLFHCKNISDIKSREIFR